MRLCTLDFTKNNRGLAWRPLLILPHVLADLLAVGRARSMTLDRPTAVAPISSQHSGMLAHTVSVCRRGRAVASIYGVMRAAHVSFPGS